MAGILRKILRAAVAQPWDYVGEGAPNGREVRMSPDGQYLALWEPGNEPWFIIDMATVRGDWVKSRDMDGRRYEDWEQFLPIKEDE